MTRWPRIGKAPDVTAWVCGHCNYAIASYQMMIIHLKENHGRIVTYKEGRMIIDDEKISDNAEGN